jgi:hypothetical protein
MSKNYEPLPLFFALITLLLKQVFGKRSSKKDRTEDVKP